MNTSTPVWVPWPRQKVVSVYLPPAIVRELGPDAMLDDGEVQHGFRVTVPEEFAIVG